MTNEEKKLISPNENWRDTYADIVWNGGHVRVFYTYTKSTDREDNESRLYPSYYALGIIYRTKETPAGYMEKYEISWVDKKGEVSFTRPGDLKAVGGLDGELKEVRVVVFEPADQSLKKHIAIEMFTPDPEDNSVYKGVIVAALTRENRPYEITHKIYRAMDKVPVRAQNKPESLEDGYGN